MHKESGMGESMEHESEKDMVLKEVERKLSEMREFPGKTSEKMIPAYEKMIEEIRNGNQEVYEEALRAFGPEIHIKPEELAELKPGKLSEKETRELEEKLSEHGGKN